MRSRQILILSNQPLFSQAVRSLVEASEGFKVIGVEAFEDTLVGRLKDMHPDIIVLGDEKNLPSTVLPILLDAVPGVRIIRLTLDGNVIRVYDGHQVVARQARDLVDTFDALFDQPTPTTNEPPSVPVSGASATVFSFPSPIVAEETPTPMLTAAQPEKIDLSGTTTQIPEETRRIEEQEPGH